MRKLTSYFFISLCWLGTISAHHVGVFCGTDEAIPDSYKKEAFELGQALAQAGYGLTTGGANTGLMNAVINGFASEGNEGHTHAVIPAIFKSLNVHHPKIPEENLTWTETIYQRLQTFSNTCDTMVVLPGGFGTLHELMDFMVPKQWGLTNKNIILINSDHYWDHLLLQFRTMVENHALKQKHLDLLVVANSIEDCIKAIQEENPSANDGLSDRYWEKK